MGNHRPNAGSFKPGNQARKGKTLSYTIKQSREFCREEMAKSAREIFSKTKADLLEDLDRDDITQWDYLLARAILSGDFKPVKFLIEMVLGRPVQQTLIVEQVERPDLSQVSTEDILRLLE